MKKSRLFVLISLVLIMISLILIIVGLILNKDNSTTSINDNKTKNDIYVCTKSRECSDKMCTADMKIKINSEDSINVSSIETNVIYKYIDKISYYGMVDFFNNTKESNKYTYNDDKLIITMISSEKYDALVKDLVMSYKNDGFSCVIEEY